MADSIPEDPPDEITACTQARATATSRPSAPRKPPATTIRTRAQKLKAAASRPQRTPLLAPQLLGPEYVVPGNSRHRAGVRHPKARPTPRRTRSKRPRPQPRIPRRPPPPFLHHPSLPYSILCPYKRREARLR
ncbi:hypothetical protein MTO96_030379 [Rhipicephalus appendiculatus]